MSSILMPTAGPDAARLAGRDPGGRILIVGGYGQVGRAIAERLAPQFPDRVVVAGRDAGKARTAAGRIGHGTEGRRIDLFAGDSHGVLDDVALVLVCLDQTDTRFVEDCLRRGIRYLDISADYAFLAQVEALDALAREHDTTALLSVGVAPGLTNLLAAHARTKMDQIDRLDILLEFGLGDHHGQAAVEWMFDNLDSAFELRENGRTKSVRGFGESLHLALPGGRPRPAWRFNFSDQHVIGRNLGVPSVSTWVRFEDRLSTWAFARAARGGLGRLLRRRRWRRLAMWLFLNVHVGSDICGVAVRATGRTKTGRRDLTVGVIGRREALMTAIIAAEIARQALAADLPRGAVHSDQAVAFEPVIAALGKELPDMTVAF